ncbi:hypothetical protein UFOVP1146_306 [uncultured Caudovirales phage]|uniref:Uncharacterized protein n=1 Tax=uncultured Caudovirales phage TaxID=2100421 RepID=A0A6J5P1K7_9CAUD|nr:hypothetical protein UFOVP812_219 [uncultured Caudovirales phage]CAB4165810.1 hypothetical protein UFOVP818_346 [uncultured Caudovirales phage]CAB4186960.1 hypothetical protein UFOVP1146_306 [uncultured Caudovirales phage]CAB4221316.1 hypothetical protein UFOVP1638_259 [uncultured Caudovirales phage]
MSGGHNMFDYLKKKFAKKVLKPRESRATLKLREIAAGAEHIKSEKDLANERGEPYVSILSMDIDPENLHQGSFELDWNEKFVSNLVRAGYQGKTDSDIVDLWFQNVCRHVVMETWEQEQAMNPTRTTKSKDIGGGRSEVS